LTKKRPKSELPPAVVSFADDWIRQCIRHVELNMVDAARDLAPDATESDLQAAAVRAFISTLIDSGMARESALELLGQFVVEHKSPNVTWNDAANRRRFALIDKDIQGTLTSAESIELAGLTRLMREHVDSEENLPMTGARRLHRQLMNQRGDSD